MIIGNGDIASVLPKRDDLLFFASGVSNSQETREEEYVREVELLRQQSISNHIVYFSSLSIFYNDTRYTEHKRQMESLVKMWFEHYTIVRLGNITWGTNPNTLINHFKEREKHGLPLEIQDTYRYIVEKDEFLHWINLIPSWICEMNITGQRMKVADIVKKYCNNIEPKLYGNT